MFLQEILIGVLQMYVAGISVWDISEFYGLTPEDTNEIIDKYNEIFLEGLP